MCSSLTAQKIRITRGLEMAEGDGETVRCLRNCSIRRVLKKKGELLDGMNPKEREVIRKRLANFSNAKEAGVSPEKAAVCFEEARQYLNAGHEFVSAADEFRNDRPRTASELYERAARNLVLGFSSEAVNACYDAVHYNSEEEKQITMRLVEFCTEEAKKNEEAGEYEKAAVQLGIAALMLEPIDFVGAFSLNAKSEVMAKRRSRGFPGQGGLGTVDGR